MSVAVPNSSVCIFCSGLVVDQVDGCYLTQSDRSSCLHKCHLNCVNQYIDSFTVEIAEHGANVEPACGRCGRSFNGFISIFAGFAYSIVIDQERGGIFLRTDDPEPAGLFDETVAAVMEDLHSLSTAHLTFLQRVITMSSDQLGRIVQAAEGAGSRQQASTTNNQRLGNVAVPATQQASGGSN